MAARLSALALVLLGIVAAAAFVAWPRPDPALMPAATAGAEDDGAARCDDIFAFASTEDPVLDEILAGIARKPCHAIIEATFYAMRVTEADGSTDGGLTVAARMGTVMTSILLPHPGSSEILPGTDFPRHWVPLVIDLAKPAPCIERWAGEVPANAQAPRPGGFHARRCDGARAAGPLAQLRGPVNVTVTAMASPQNLGGDAPRTSAAHDARPIYTRVVHGLLPKDGLVETSLPGVSAAFEEAQAANMSGFLADIHLETGEGVPIGSTIALPIFNDWDEDDVVTLSFYEEDERDSAPE